MMFLEDVLCQNGIVENDRVSKRSSGIGGLIAAGRGLMLRPGMKRRGYRNIYMDTEGHTGRCS